MLKSYPVTFLFYLKQVTSLTTVAGAVFVSNIHRCRDRFLMYTRDSEVRQQLGPCEKRGINLEHNKEENMVKKKKKKAYYC